MNETEFNVARGNHAFYYLFAGMVMLGDDFVRAFLTSLTEERLVLFGIELSDHSGYIEIDTSDIIDQRSRGSMGGDARNGLLSEVAFKIPSAITGEMNTDVTIDYGIYRFSFRITKYERDGDHGFELIEDPTQAEKGERLGRFVALKVTIRPTSS